MLINELKVQCSKIVLSLSINFERTRRTIAEMYIWHKAVFETFVDTVIKYYLYYTVAEEFRESERRRVRTNEGSCGRGFSRLLNIVIKKQSALLPSTEDAICAALLAPQRNKAIFPRLRRRDVRSRTAPPPDLKRNVISVPFCGLTRAR